MERSDVDTAPVKMVGRFAFILTTLSERGVEGLSLTELVEMLSLRKTTAHRLLAALIDVGFVFQDLNTKRYRLGSAVTKLARAASGQFVSGASQPVLRRIAEQTGDTVYATIREGTAAICVAREIGSFPIRTLTLDVGDRRPLGVGAGSLALLSFLSDDDVESVLHRNARWLEDFQHLHPDVIRKLVARTRREGYALNEGQVIPGMNALGFPVHSKSGELVASISIAAIKDRVGPERVPELVALLRESAAELSEIISFSNSND